MNLLKLSLSYIKRRKLNTVLNVLILALGIATIVVLLLFKQQFEENLTKNSKGINAVVGAKGSPLQLILSSIYHMDVPTGNIPVKEVQKLIDNRAVKRAIPLSLGDNYRGYRIVGTIPDYLELYKAEFSKGEIWNQSLEVVIGAEVAETHNLSLGDKLVSVHGFDGDGEAHGDHAMTVVGILKPNGSVLDRLVLSDLHTIWDVHGAGGSHDDHAHEENAVSPPGGKFRFAEEDAAKQITSLLVEYSSPMAAVMFPRFVNGTTTMQAAAPAVETARLFSLLGVGLDALRAFGFILMLVAALGIFIALYNALKDRRYDLAMMRTLGASPGKLLMHVLLEGLILTGMGIIAGLLIGHISTEWLGGAFSEARQMNLTGWKWLSEEWLVIGVTLAIGVVASLIPAVQAYKTDIAKTLQKS
ncbi:MAG: FtsX-like permease family protein [Calditrichota bacterium]